MNQITIEAYLMGRAKLGDLPADMQENAKQTVNKANLVMARFGEYRSVNSGYRRPEDNAAIKNAATKSKHMTCQAIDISDRDGKLKSWLLANLDLLEELGLYMEHPSATPTWAHLQIVPPRSNNRVFYP